MSTRIVIKESRNFTPEDEINEAIAPLLAEGFRVVSATTSLALFGDMIHEMVTVASHVYYVTTVVLEKGE